ncbi:hypothetical protein [Streptomyces rimosus]|uniref:hypothetical protein n=1 Tax=Streptomyces rimosus TaxID=1927 RepID=UPI00131AF7FB|nr:hypothetical protein [Streptomyces rimosus]
MKRKKVLDPRGKVAARVVDAQTAAAIEKDFLNSLHEAVTEALEPAAAYGMAGHHGDGERAARVETSGLIGWITLHRSARPVDTASPGDPHRAPGRVLKPIFAGQPLVPEIQEPLVPSVIALAVRACVGVAQRVSLGEAGRLGPVGAVEVPVGRGVPRLAGRHLPCRRAIGRLGRHRRTTDGERTHQSQTHQRVSCAHDSPLPIAVIKVAVAFLNAIQEFPHWLTFPLQERTEPLEYVFARQQILLAPMN